MTLIKAIVRRGRLETEKPLDLPEGTELLIPLGYVPVDEEEAWDDTPEGIADWLAWYDSLQPLKRTAEEEADAEAWLKKCDEHGQTMMEAGLGMHERAGTPRNVLPSPRFGERGWG